MMSMTKKFIPVYAVAVAMLVIAAAFSFSKKKVQPGSDWLSVDVRALKMTGGWGYEVMVDKKIFIHQDCIPAIAAFKRFGTEAEALLIGNKVVDKILHGQKPAISLQEIADSRIRY